MDAFFGGDFLRMQELADHMRRAAGQDQLLLTSAATLRVLADHAAGRIQEAVATLAEAESAFALIEDGQLLRFVDLPALVALGAMRLERADRGLDHLRRAKALEDLTGQRAAVPGWLAMETWLLLLKGQVTEALRVAETAVDAAVVSGNPRSAMWAYEADSTAAFLAGDTERPLVSAQEVVEDTLQVPETFFSGARQLEFGAALYLAGDPAAARRELTVLDCEESWHLLDLNVARGWEVLALTQLALGDLEAAEQAGARAETRAAAAGLPQQWAKARYLRGTVQLARGDPRTAIELAAAAMEGAEDAGNPMQSGRARALMGAALVAAGKQQEGIEALELAIGQLSGCGAFRDADAAGRELRRLGRRVPRHGRGPGPGPALSQLSQREAEVAAHVTSGKTNREIAAILFLSEKTVESHLGRIYGKLGVHSRVALAAMMTLGHDGPTGGRPASVRRHSS